MLFCPFVKNFAENNVPVDDVIWITFTDRFNFNIYTRAPTRIFAVHIDCASKAVVKGDSKKIM